MASWADEHFARTEDEQQYDHDEDPIEEEDDDRS